MPNEAGAHCKQREMNSRSLGSCFVGNFDLEPPPDIQMELGLRLVRSLCEVCDISKDRIFGHREFASYKSCPGKLFGIERFIRQI